jgi:hypothetical protein
VQCDLADLDGARAAIDVGRTISAADIPEARWLLLLLESACLVATESPQAEEYLAAAKLEARNLPELQYLIAMVEFRSRLARGERIVDDLHVLIKQAERDGRRDRLCSLELLAFEADPPADATAACRQAIARHRHYVGDTQLARLLAFTTELLAARGQFPAARALFQEAQLALLQAAQSIQPAERRARYLSDASLPLQRAALINREDLPLFLSEVLPAKVVRGVFGRMTINLGYLSLGLAIVARWGVLMRSTPIPLNAAMIVCLFVALCWFGSLAATIASLLRSERRYAQVLVGMVLATAGLVLAAQLLPDATKGDPKNLRNYPPHSAGPIPASS